MFRGPFVRSCLRSSGGVCGGMGGVGHSNVLLY